MLIQLEKVVLKSLNMEDPEEMKLVEKLQEDLFEKKMMYEDLRRQLAKFKEEQKKEREIQEAQIKIVEDLDMILKQQHEESLRKHDETITGIATLLEMIKKQQQP